MHCSRVIAVSLLVLVGGCGGSDDDGVANAFETAQEIRDGSPEPPAQDAGGDEPPAQDAPVPDLATIPDLPDQPLSWPHTGVFLSAGACGECHRASAPGDAPAVMRTPAMNEAQPSPSGEDISPYTGWRASVMANSLNDPYFRATMMHESRHFSALSGFIEDKCLTCHAPMGRTHAHQTRTSLQQDACTLADGCYRAATAIGQPVAREGVSCTLCHQITDEVLGGQINSGAFQIPSFGDTIYGPYQNPVGQAMQNRTGYRPVFGLQTQSSQLCAACHDLFTPVIAIEDDLPTGDYFPEQTPFLEWQQSVYATGQPQEQQCQDCHMGRMPDNYVTRIAIRPSGAVNTAWPERSPFFGHDMVGGNAWLLETLDAFGDELGVTQVASESSLADKAEKTRAFLRDAAELRVTNPRRENGQLAFDLTIVNRTGHKLPTSFPSRRIWVATRVRDGSGNDVFVSGFPDASHRLPADAQFASATCTAERKPASFDNSGCFAPHVQVVTSEQDVPRYEAVLAATNGSITQVLLYANSFLKDNRIPPEGYIRDQAPEATHPTGVDGDADFNANGSGTDTIQYRLPVAGATGPFAVELVLFYQTVRPSFVEVVTGSHDWIQQFRAMAAERPPVAESIATAAFAIPD